MFQLNFSKLRAEELLAAISNDESIPVPISGWNTQGLLEAAGALMHAALQIESPAGASWPFPGATKEYREAAMATRSTDFHDTIDVHAGLCCLVQNGKYDRYFETNVIVKVWRDDGDPMRDFVQGQKD
jgi:hypothetical protein